MMHLAASINFSTFPFRYLKHFFIPYLFYVVLDVYREASKTFLIHFGMKEAKERKNEAKMFYELN